MTDTNDAKRALLYSNDFLVHSKEFGDTLIEVQHLDTRAVARTALYDFLNQNFFTKNEYEMILEFAKNIKNVKN